MEIARALSNIWLYISLVIGTSVCVLDTISFRHYENINERTSLIQTWIGTDFPLVYNSLYYILFPLVATIPYAASYFDDMNSGFDKNICIKVSRKSYMASKMIAVYISGFVAVTFPLLVNLFVCAGLYPNYLPNKLEFLTAGIIDVNMFPMLFNKHPGIYALVYILLDGMFGGALSLVSIAFSKFAGNHFSVVMLPFAVYIMAGVSMRNSTGVNCWSIMEMVNPVQNYSSNWWQIMIVYMILGGISVVVTYLYSIRRDVV
jgi:hypothetical protein